MIFYLLSYMELAVSLSAALLERERNRVTTVDPPFQGLSKSRNKLCS